MIPLEINKIENVNIFQNMTHPNYNSATLIYRDSSGKPFLLYIEKLSHNANLTFGEEKLSMSIGDTFKINRDFFFESQIYPNQSNSIFRIVDLSFEPELIKEMTKEQIEKTLGYKIKIVEKK